MLFSAILLVSRESCEVLLPGKERYKERSRHTTELTYPQDTGHTNILGGVTNFNAKWKIRAFRKYRHMLETWGVQWFHGSQTWTPYSRLSARILPNEWDWGITGCPGSGSNLSPVYIQCPCFQQKGALEQLDKSPAAGKRGFWGVWGTKFLERMEVTYYNSLTCDLGTGAVEALIL